LVDDLALLRLGEDAFDHSDLNQGHERLLGELGSGRSWVQRLQTLRFRASASRTTPRLRRVMRSTLRGIPARGLVGSKPSGPPSRNSRGPAPSRPDDGGSWPKSTDRRPGPSPLASPGWTEGSPPPRDSGRYGNRPHLGCCGTSQSSIPAVPLSRP